MTFRRGLGAAIAAVAMLCAVPGGHAFAEVSAAQKVRKVIVTIDTQRGPRVFNVEVARTSAEQERGLMFRTELPADGGMIFTPYPPEGGAPRVAQFWMKNTPTPLDIIFIRADGTIAKVAADAAPYSQDHYTSDEPVAAVLEIHAGKSAELGIAPGDKVRWGKVRK